MPYAFLRQLAVLLLPAERSLDMRMKSTIGRAAGDTQETMGQTGGKNMRGRIAIGADQLAGCAMYRYFVIQSAARAI